MPDKPKSETEDNPKGVTGGGKDPQKVGNENCDPPPSKSDTVEDTQESMMVAIAAAGGGLVGGIAGGIIGVLMAK